MKSIRSRFVWNIWKLFFSGLFLALMLMILYAMFLSSNKGNNAPTVVWNTAVNYTAGDCDTSNYSAWCPHNLQYDSTRGKFVFLQCHSNGHLGGFSAGMTLCYLNPENPLDYEELNCPDFTGMGALLVRSDGSWYIWTEYYRYRSWDAGETWEEEELVTPLPSHYGVWEIDGVLYMGDDFENNSYRVSKDGGLTWESEKFGVPYGCEASFCKFQGEIYAFLRTNYTEYAMILRKTFDGWECVSDHDIYVYQSDCSVVAFDDYIAIAHISRSDCHLYYTLWDGKYEFYTEDLGQIEADTVYKGDCHSAALAFGDGYACIAFMMHTYGTSAEDQFICAQNCWVIGTYEEGKKVLVPEVEAASTTEISPAVNESIMDSEAENPLGINAYVRNGRLVLYGTEALGAEADEITPAYLCKYEPYAVTEYGGSTYICVTGNGMMMSLQRKNTIYESTYTVGDVLSEEKTELCQVTNGIIDFGISLLPRSVSLVWRNSSA